MKTSRALPLLILAAFLSVQAAAQDKLEYKFVKGKTYLFSVVTDGNMTQEMAGQEMKMSNASNMTIRTVVDDVKGGNLVLIVSADSAVSSMKSPMRDTTMVMSNMIGKRVKVTVSKKGDVVNREILDSISFSPQMRGGGQREMVSFMTLPDKPVKSGDTWTSTKVDTVESMGGQIINAVDYEFTAGGKEKKLGHDCVKIMFKGKHKINGNMKMMGMELFVEGGGKSNGSYYFDAGKGLPVLVESINDTETTMAATGQQQMTIPISQTTKTTMSLIKE